MSDTQCTQCQHGRRTMICDAVVVEPQPGGGAGMVPDRIVLMCDACRIEHNTNLAAKYRDADPSEVEPVADPDQPEDGMEEPDTPG